MNAQNRNYRQEVLARGWEQSKEQARSREEPGQTQGKVRGNEHARGRKQGNKRVNSSKEMPAKSNGSTIRESGTVGRERPKVSKETAANHHEEQRRLESRKVIKRCKPDK